jgi:hypothetical protein
MVLKCGYLLKNLGVTYVGVKFFRVFAPCSLVEICRRFRGACCLHHQTVILILGAAMLITCPARLICLIWDPHMSDVFTWHNRMRNEKLWKEMDVTWSVTRKLENSAEILWPHWTNELGTIAGICYTGYRQQQEAEGESCIQLQERVKSVVGDGSLEAGDCGNRRRRTNKYMDKHKKKIKKRVSAM